MKIMRKLAAALLATVFSAVMATSLAGGRRDLFQDILPEKQKFYFVMVNMLEASLLALVDRMAESAVDPAGQTVFISHGDCEADADFVADEVRRRFGVKEIYINYVGPVIGNHSGPGTLALFFLGSHR